MNTIICLGAGIAGFAIGAVMSYHEKRNLKYALISGAATAGFLVLAFGIWF